MHRLIRFIMLLALLAVATPALAVYRTPVVFTNASSAKGQAMTQIDSAALRASNVIASDSCADVAFYNATGSTRLKHWFETACPAPPGSKTNVWVQTAVPTGATTVLMLSGADHPQTGNELTWSGSFVLANGQDNCPGGWNLRSEMADYFPLPGATWGTVSPGGHSHNLKFQTNGDTGTGVDCDSGVEHDSDEISSNNHTWDINTPPIGEAGLPPWVRVPFCGKGKLDIVAGQLALFSGSLPAGSSAEPSQQGRFWRGSAGPFGETGGAATHQHTASGKSSYDIGGLAVNVGTGPDQVLYHHHMATVTTQPVSSLPSHADFVPGRLAAGFNSFDAGGMTLFADQPPPLGWQPYATADNYYLRLAASSGVPVAQTPHNHGQALESSTVSNAMSDWILGVDNIPFYTCTSYHTHILHTSSTISTTSNAPPAFGVQLYQRLPQAGVTAAVGQSEVVRALTVTKDGLGLVTSSPGGIFCGSSCSGVFNEGSLVTLSATPDTGSIFTGWSGGGCSTGPTCTVTISSDTTVTATFKKVHFDVTAPATVITGAPFSVTATAKDPANNTLSGYSGTIQFSSSDPSATLPGPSLITNGTATFNGLQFATPGSQTLTVATVAPTGTPTGYWKFNEGSGTVAQDSASGWNGDLTNIAWRPDVPPVIQFPDAGSLQFNGSSSFVYLANVKTPNTLTPELTIQAWIKPAALDKPQVLFSNGMCNVNCATLQLGIGGDATCDPGSGVPNTINFLIETTTVKYSLAQVSALNVDQWSHAAVTYDGANIKLYINGVLEATTPATGTLLGDHLYTIGADPGLNFGCSVPGTGATPFVRSAYNGTMDDLRIYNRALSDVEIAMAASGLQGSIITGDPNGSATIRADVELNVTIVGSAGNKVESTTPEQNINCVQGMPGGCSASYQAGTTVSLSATGSNAKFSGWSWSLPTPGTASETTLDVLMDGNKELTASFVTNPRVRIDGSATLYYALGSTLAIPGGPATIRAQEAPVFAENIIMTNPVAILLKGGYSDADFISQGGYSTISGSLKIQAGTLKVDHIKIMPCDGSAGCTPAIPQCIIGGTIYAAGASNPANPCQVCNPANPAEWSNQVNGTSCNDGDACTQTDTCQAGVCTGANPVTCSAQDQCHDAGSCNPTTGVCSNPARADGSACNDGNACTQSDTCQTGACVGANPVTCTAQDQCHTAGSCNPTTGVCSNPVAPDGSACNDGNACTQPDICQAGVCTGIWTCPVCGNGTVEAGETCDDNNTNGGDGCSATCQAEPGYICTGAPSVCTMQPPTVTGTTPADASMSTAGPSVTVTFSMAMNPATLTAQTTAGACSGSIQVSLDNFASCIAFSAGAASMSGGNTVATLTAAPALLVNRSYKIRVTTAVRTSGDSAMDSQFTTPTGFFTQSPNLCNGSVVISQMYGGGGLAGAGYRNDFVELHNRGSAAVNLAGWSLQYASAAGTTWQVVNLSGPIAAGGYYLIGLGSGGTNGIPLQTPDLSGSIDMSATAGKVALVSNTAALPSVACPSGATIIDFVGYGITANCFEGVAAAAAPSATLSVQRNQSGCGDVNDNSGDFVTGTPTPHNSTTTTSICGCYVRNESGAALEADYCSTQFPLSLNMQAGAPSGMIYGQIYELGVTEAAGANTNVRAQVGYGLPGKNPEYETWNWFNATYNVQSGNNDEYQGSFTLPAASSYRYVYRFSLDQGVSWTTCDNNQADSGAGSSPGLTFSIADEAVLTVQ